MMQRVTTLGSPPTIDLRASTSNVHPNRRRMGVKISQLAMRCVRPEPVVDMESNRRLRPVVALMAREKAIPCINAILFSPTINTEPLFLLNNAGDTDPVSPNHAATSAGREIIVVESVMVGRGWRVGGG